MIFMKLKHIPNMLSFSRVILTILLIFISPTLGLISFIVYCVAGFTDMIDGPLARRIPNGQSKIGTALDSTADMLMIIVGVFFIMPAMEIWTGLWFTVIGALVFKILSASISGLVKHKQVLFTHTIMNKVAALFLFSAPIVYFIIGSHLAINVYIVFIVCWVFVATLEEAAINLLLVKPNTNIRGIWKVKAENSLSR